MSSQLSIVTMMTGATATAATQLARHETTGSATREGAARARRAAAANATALIILTIDAAATGTATCATNSPTTTLLTPAESCNDHAVPTAAAHVTATEATKAEHRRSGAKTAPHLRGRKAGNNAEPQPSISSPPTVGAKERTDIDLRPPQTATPATAHHRPNRVRGTHRLLTNLPLTQRPTAPRRQASTPTPPNRSPRSSQTPTSNWRSLKTTQRSQCSTTPPQLLGPHPCTEDIEHSY